MKNYIVLLVFVLTSITPTLAQEKTSAIPTISLDQTPGEFTQKTITVKEGTYIFTINNKNVGHDVGFVLVPKGKDLSSPANHIKTAYVSAAVANNTSGRSSATTLTKGSYYYFCPLNPTSTDNLLIVE